MPIFSRHPALPEPVRLRLALRRGDRVLAAAPLTDDSWAVASRAALHVAPEPAEADATIERHPWTDVDRASLEAESAVLTVHLVSGSTRALALADPEHSVRFAQVLRERVQSSVVHSEVVSLPAGGLVKVALRRDENGELLSQVIGDGTTNLADPTVAALVDAAERRVRGAAGLPG
ncbi:MAG: hypothetical protein ACYCTH_08210 [Cellulomonas sp.]